MDSCVITLTPGDIKNNKLNIRPCGLDFFPKDILGGSSKKSRPRHSNNIASRRPAGTYKDRYPHREKDKAYTLDVQRKSMGQKVCQCPQS